MNKINIALDCIEKIISGQNPSTEGFTMSNFFISISANHLKIYSDSDAWFNNSNIQADFMLPTSDFKVILQAWRNFLAILKKYMNYTILNLYDVKFVIIDGRKKVSFKGNELIERYLSIFKDLRHINKFLHEIELVQSGHIEECETYLYGSIPQILDYGAGDGGVYINADIAQNAIVLSEENIINNSITIPLTDWKEILISWREFLTS